MRIASAIVHGKFEWLLNTDRGYYRAGALAQNLGVPSSSAGIETVIDGGNAVIEALRVWQRTIEEEGIAPDESQVELTAPVPRPGKIICVGLNYRPHVQESQMQIPSSPVLFNKYLNSVIGPNAVVNPPSDAEQMDYEAELVVVIGRTASKVAESEALGYVFGYMNGNDLSDRGLQFRTGQWLLGKAADGFAPMGPYVATRDEVPDPGNLDIRCFRNARQVQGSNTREMIFSVPFLIHYISQYITLAPGDVIFTGTPEGVIVGLPEAERNWLRAGDQTEVAIEGLGSLTTRIGPNR